MPNRFDRKKAIHLILFLLHSLGKHSDPQRLFLLLYLADLKHLARYGSLISRDSYIALKNGPVPFHIMAIYQQVKEEAARGEKVSLSRKNTDSLAELIGIDAEGRLTAMTAYNSVYLLASEVECLFETMQDYKGKSIETLTASALNDAWRDANVNGEISIDDMKKEAIKEIRKSPRKS